VSTPSYLTPHSLIFSFPSSPPPRHLHSFPTRRSSDLTAIRFLPAGRSWSTPRDGSRRSGTNTAHRAPEARRAWHAAQRPPRPCVPIPSCLQAARRSRSSLGHRAVVKPTVLPDTASASFV